eukprot:SAG31_NODE_12499_length_937_cov_0.708831_1_plen_169_part_00
MGPRLLKVGNTRRRPASTSVVRTVSGIFVSDRPASAPDLLKRHLITSSSSRRAVQGQTAFVGRQRSAKSYYDSMSSSSGVLDEVVAQEEQRRRQHQQQRQYSMMNLPEHSHSQEVERLGSASSASRESSRLQGRSATLKQRPKTAPASKSIAASYLRSPQFVSWARPK